METSTKPDSVDLASVAKNLDLPVEKVTSAVQLLEAGNTIPFVTRYRKDETGGLAERQLRDIKKEVARQTALAERKSVVLKAIENQGKLTDELRHQIERASQARQVEDLYHPYKPRKTSLAETARQQGLEPLARDILEGHQPDIDLASRATDFVRVDRGLTSVDEVIKGVKHILAERFSEHIQLRTQLRKLFWETGSIKTEAIASPEPEATEPSETKKEPVPPTSEKTSTAEDSTKNKASVSDEPENPECASAEIAVPAESAEATAEQADSTDSGTVPTPTDPAGAPEPATPSGEESATEQVATQPMPVAEASGESQPASEPVATAPKKKKKRKKKKKSRPEPFAEFASFEESLQKLPPHRTLAINRGEKAGKLKVRLQADPRQLNDLARSSLVPEDHPFAEFLLQVSEDAMQRLILPGIEREIRRDVTERSETHAVNVFARNLRHLFLQPPVRGQRIMGIDPGYRSGCKVAVIDATGQPVGHGVFSIVGNAERIKNNQQRLKDLITRYQPHLIAIGNGSGCRAVEQFVSDVISGEMADQQVQYTIVNQAGTSGYSTSELGQQELPDHDPVIRSAISIARRLQDPLSELVKVNPANVGVGLYQHDIKAKHLADSLESVVESCVNFVGVNANTASPALLKYISGLGQTTARKLVEHRNQNGSFAARENLKEVSGFGDVTFIQAAGFLRIDCSQDPLDRTSIHPEDYELANKILARLDCTINELTPPPVQPKPVARPAPVAVSETTKDTPSTSANEDATSAPANENAAPASEPPENAPESAETSPATESPATPEAANVDSPAAETPSSPPVVAPALVTPPAISPAMLAESRKRRKELVQRIKGLNAAELARELGVGEMKMQDLLRSLRNPCHDPREDLPAPVFRKGILKFDDLKKGMQLRGQIVNVVDFGVFLNIGIGESCLVHISRLANRYVRDPHWFYAVGDVLNVWVQEIDSEKRRVTLTAIRPDSQRSDRRRRPKAGEQGSGGYRRGKGGAHAGKGKKRHSAGRGKPHTKRPRKPKPVTPITDEMVEGKAPMRSFSDLLQFHQRKSSDSDDSKGKS